RRLVHSLKITLSIKLYDLKVRGVIFMDFMKLIKLSLELTNLVLIILDKIIKYIKKHIKNDPPKSN
ncbi:MAG TPA: hypothetical protein DEQ02_00560, partial [Ruminococcaceae bacterium]|nr:hypothetical protein [Oscillospiraceae bacterium]